MKIKLAYGKNGYMVNLPDVGQVDVIESKWVEPVKNQYRAITVALRSPIKSKTITDLVNGNSKVGIVFSDNTRATPYHIILPPLLEELKFLPTQNITFFCATGTHRQCTRQELIDILGAEIVSNYKIVQNEANKPGLFKYIGTTESGNKVLLNKELLNCDLKILTGFIEPHFFAGFSGGGKAIMPGMSALESIRFNHSIAHLSDSNATWGTTSEGNPVWEDIMQAAELAGPLFLLNVTLNKNKDVTNVFAGDLRTAHDAGCQYVKNSAMVCIEQPYDIVITSNAGYPLDLNIYQAVKGLSAAAQITKENGHIIIVAECWDGIPANSDFEKILEAASGHAELISHVKKCEGHLQDTWQIYVLAKIQQRFNTYLYTDKLGQETIRKTLLTPVKNIRETVNTLIQKIGERTKICVLPEGPYTIPYLK